MQRFQVIRANRRSSHQYVSFESQQQPCKNNTAYEQTGMPRLTHTNAYMAGTHPCGDNWREMCVYASAKRRICLCCSRTHACTRTYPNSNPWAECHFGFGRQWRATMNGLSSPDQYHMHLALHLYHVSALAFRGLEKFRSTRREMQAGGQSEQQESGAEWKIDWLFFLQAELTSAFFFFFCRESTWQTRLSHEFDLSAPLKTPGSPDTRCDRWGEVKIAESGEATRLDLSSAARQLHLREIPPEDPSSQQPAWYRLKHVSAQEGLANTTNLRSPLQDTWLMRGC